MTIETPNADTANSHNTSSQDTTPTQEAPSWWIDEGVPGSGNKPEWLDNKFKSAADLARSYKELEQRVGTVPDSYDFTKSKYLDPEYGPFKDFQDFAKQKRVSQDVVDKMLESVDKYFGEFTTDYNEERKKLGDNAKERLDTLNNWAQANLSENAYVALTSHMTSADAVLAIEEIRNKMMSNTTTVPNGNETTSSGLSLDEVQSELTNNLDKYKTDAKYRREMTAKLEQAAKQSEFVDKNR